MTGAMATVTPLCQAPMVAEGLALVINRSASARPTSGLAWLSAKTSLSLAPPRLGIPFQPAPSSELPAAALTPPLIMSAANSAPTLQSWPVPGAGPEREDHAHHDLLRRLGVDRHHPQRDHADDRQHQAEHPSPHRVLPGSSHRPHSPL